jgi:hypothetical protein
MIMKFCPTYTSEVMRQFAFTIKELFTFNEEQATWPFEMNARRLGFQTLIHELEEDGLGI